MSAKELEVGMYVRTDDGYIGKIQRESWQYYKSYDVDELYYDIEKQDYRSYLVNYEITKANHNIVDLIKKGDIILGKDGNIYACQKVYKDYVFTYSKNKQGLTITLVDYQIDKILTHEQFEREAYKV